nr:hypothetical protein [Tanacetum cinerariifolium]
HGFDLGYKTWVHHGEPALPPPPPVIDITRQPQMSDMTALLNDLSYIPLNNEHDEPTQGDIGLATSGRSLGTQFDLRPHMESPDWTEINNGIQQHLQKAYSTNKAAFKAQHWVIDPTTGTYNVEKIRRARHENITAIKWDNYIQFWNDPRNISRAAQNRGRAQPLMSTRRSLTPSLWHTLLTRNSFEISTDEEMGRLEATGTYTDDEINHLARGGKQ